jgi:hypothetical protein
MPVVNRSYRSVERQWLGEYLAQLHPTVTAFYEKRLHYEHPSAIARGPGGSPTGTEGRAVARLDAWIELADEIEVWEAAQWFHFGKLAQEEHYRDLLPRTYEGKHQVTKPVRWFALTSHARREIRDACGKAAIEYHVYLPDWLREHQIESQMLGEARRRQFQEEAAARAETAQSASASSGAVVENQIPVPAAPALGAP